MVKCSVHWLHALQGNHSCCILAEWGNALYHSAKAGMQQATCVANMPCVRLVRKCSTGATMTTNQKLLGSRSYYITGMIIY